MLNWRLNVSTNCATFSGIALTVGRKSNIQFNQTNFLYTIVAWAAIAPTGSAGQVCRLSGRNTPALKDLAEYLCNKAANSAKATWRLVGPQQRELDCLLQGRIALVARTTDPIQPLRRSLSAGRQAADQTSRMDDEVL